MCHQRWFFPLISFQPFCCLHLLGMSFVVVAVWLGSIFLKWSLYWLCTLLTSPPWFHVLACLYCWQTKATHVLFVSYYNCLISLIFHINWCSSNKWSKMSGFIHCGCPFYKGTIFICLPLSILLAPKINFVDLASFWLLCTWRHCFCFGCVPPFGFLFWLCPSIWISVLWNCSPFEKHFRIYMALIQNQIVVVFVAN